jgi:hypothetical protein
MPLIDPAYQSTLEGLVNQVFDQMKRPFTLYVEAQVANISTNPNYSRFGQHDQNVFNPAVNPQATVVYGTILYANQQPWEMVAPENRTNYQQDKLRESFGQVRIKVDASGYALMQNVKLVNLDGFNFKPVGNARPHGVFSPQRYTFYLIKVD